MNITVLHIANCPNWTMAVERATEAARGWGADVSVSDQLISTSDEAEKWSFAGSPTLLLDGVDMFPSDGHSPDLACRIYVTPRGLQGAPTSDQIRERLDAHDR